MLGGPGRPHCGGDILRRDRNDKLIHPGAQGRRGLSFTVTGLQRKVEPQLGGGPDFVSLWQRTMGIPHLEPNSPVPSHLCHHTGLENPAIPVLPGTPFTPNSLSPPVCWLGPEVGGWAASKSKPRIFP